MSPTIDPRAPGQLGVNRAEQVRARQNSSRLVMGARAQVGRVFEEHSASGEQMSYGGSPLLRAFDALMVLYPELLVCGIDLQFPSEDHPEGGPWCVIEYENHPGHAIWKRTGAIHRMTYFGAVEDDPLLSWDADGMPTIGRSPL